jgi:hypothetical protein
MKLKFCKKKKELIYKHDKTLHNIHIFYLPLLCHTFKRLNFHQTMDEGIAYIGGIMMW